MAFADGFEKLVEQLTDQSRVRAVTQHRHVSSSIDDLDGILLLNALAQLPVAPQKLDGFVLIFKSNYVCQSTSRVLLLSGGSGRHDFVNRFSR